MALHLSLERKIQYIVYDEMTKFNISDLPHKGKLTSLISFFFFTLTMAHQV